jgi:polar amino acid transport system substrate-binding protein
VKVRLCLAVVAALWGCAGQTREIRLCMTGREFLPINSPNFEAPGQYLARLAIERQGDKALFVGLPWRRCVEGLRHGEYDGALGMVATASFYTFMRFPQANGNADASRALGNLVYVAARLKGSAAGWNGERFRGLRQPVIYNAPSLVLADKMHRLGAGNPNISLSEEQMLSMLVAGRADLAVGRQDVFESLIAGDAFRDRVEVLPVPFVDAESYLAFREGFEDPIPGYVERVWDEIGRQIAAPDWPQTKQRLLTERKPFKPS